MFVAGGQDWSQRAQALFSKVVENRDSIKGKIKADFAVSILSHATISILTKIGCERQHRFFTDRHQICSRLNGSDGQGTDAAFGCAACWLR
jgi:hypothetical protein